MTSGLELVRAGAGSGKTTDLCRVVAEAVDGGLDPARLLATTFTRKAAAELKARMQAKLLARPGDRRRRAHEAERLELAAIGTVHGVAHGILSRYAVEMGLSPKLEVMEEAAESRVLGELLGMLSGKAWEALEGLADRLGIEEDDLKRLLLSLLSAKRGNRLGDDVFTAQLRASADRVCSLLAGGGPLLDDPKERFVELLHEALDGLEAISGDQQNVTNEARQKLRRLASGSVPLWGAQVEARRLKAGKRTGADACLEPLRNHAAGVVHQVGMHADVREFTRCVTEVALGLGAVYARYKKERGLLDFTDLEILFLELLEHPGLGRNIAGDYDLVLVDEFQDTNPLQLAIFRCLRHRTPRSRWVGDPKQAIYGFRGTDPHLVDELWTGVSGATRRELPRNHRSQKGLVELVGKLFVPVLGAEARQDSFLPGAARGVERWCLDTRNKESDARALACGVARLGAEGMRWGDIAVLARTHKALGTLAGTLGSLGIPCLLETPGLLSSREGALALAGLRLVADRGDALAAATVMHLLAGPGPDTPAWVTERLRARRAVPGEGEAKTPRPWEGDARLVRLEGIPSARLSPTQILQAVMEALELPSRIASWSDPARRSAHLDSLLRHAREHEEIARRSGLSATLDGLVLYLERLAEARKDVCHPPLGHNAVTLVTYHGAKGLEWPTVILSDLNDTKTPDLWSPVVTGGGRSDTDPLEGRTLRAWVWPFGKSDGEFAKLRKGSGLEERALVSAEGEALVAQQDREAVRLLYVGCTRAKRKLVFVTRAGEAEWLAALPDADRLLDPALPEGEHPLPGIDTTLVIRRLDGERSDECRVEANRRQSWMQPVSRADGSNVDEVEPRFHSPSGASPVAAGGAGELEELPGAAVFPHGAGEDRYGAMGDAVHAYLAALPSLWNLAGPAKEAVAERCLSAHGVTGLLAAADVVAAGERFRAWVERRYPAAIWQTEVSGSAPRSAGGRWLGTMDLLLRTSGGGVVLVDHKSAPIRRAHCVEKAREYDGQLAAYREVLVAHGERVEATWVHFPLAGAVVRK